MGGTRITARFLTATFWISVVVFVVLLAAYTIAGDLILSLLGQTGAVWAFGTLIGLVLFSSGVLMRHHRRTKSGGDHPERYWSGAETFFAIVFYLTLFVSLWYLPVLFFSS